MKTFKIKTELTLQDIKDLKDSLDRSSNNYTLYLELLDIVEKEDRKTITVGNKKYYEDEVEKALAKIKPIK